MHVKCGRNGEACKINIAGVIFRFVIDWRSAHLSMARAVDVFALRVLSIVVLFFDGYISDM